MYLFQSKIDKNNAYPSLNTEYARKRIYNGYSVWIEKFVTRNNSWASIGKPHDAEQLPSWWNFQSAPHNH